MKINFNDMKTQIVIVFIIFAIVWLTGYKEEILLCNIPQERCTVSKTNNLNIKTTKFIAAPKDIADIFITKRGRLSQRNRHFNGIHFDNTVFIRKIDGKNVKIFTEYSNQSDAEQKVNEIKSKLKSGNEIIEVIR